MGSRDAQQALHPGRVVLVADRATGLPQLAALLSKPTPTSTCAVLCNHICPCLLYSPHAGCALPMLACTKTLHFNTLSRAHSHLLLHTPVLAGMPMIQEISVSKRQSFVLICAPRVRV